MGKANDAIIFVPSDHSIKFTRHDMRNTRSANFQLSPAKIKATNAVTAANRARTNLKRHGAVSLR
jgi:hypothetical protein